MEATTEIISYLRNDWSVQVTEQLSFEELTLRLAQHINYLIHQDFNQLIRLLYTIDVDESKLKRLLRDNTDDNAGMIIAGLIIERQMQKIQSRKFFKSNNDACDEDKW